MCAPVDNDDPDNDELHKLPNILGNSQLIQKHQKLIQMAQELLSKLRRNGKNDQAQKLWQAIECANRSLQAFMSINPGREFNFSVKAIIENLKKAQDKLDHLIHDLKDNNDDQFIWKVIHLYQSIQSIWEY